MQTIARSPAGTVARTSRRRICFLILGYLVTLAGCCFFFSLLMVYLLAAGCAIMVVASIGVPQPRVTWRSTVTATLGCAIIIGVLSLFGQDRVRTWRPHPAGYIPAWLLCLYAFRQLREIFSSLRDDEKVHG